MIGVLPNPKKTFQVEKPISEVRQAIEHLPLFTTKYKLFKSNPVLNQFTFDTTEFLSLGVYIDMNCFSLTDNRTEVSMEVRRKVGSFDQSHEVSLANTHISTLTDLISESISTNPNERLKRIDQIETNKRNKVETQKQKLEGAKRKAEEERQNNPVLYYTKQALMIAATLALLGGMVYMFYKFVLQ